MYDSVIAALAILYSQTQPDAVEAIDILFSKAMQIVDTRDGNNDLPAETNQRAHQLLARERDLLKEVLRQR